MGAINEKTRVEWRVRTF